MHELHFTSEGTGPAEITVAASGLTTASELQVAKVGLGQIEKGKIRLELEAGKRVSICFNLAESFHGPMELSAMTTSETVESAS